MKNLLIRATLVLTLLLALGAIFSTSAHAASHTTSSVKPSINIAYCTGYNQIILYTTTGPNVCFENSGYTPATVPNVGTVCSFGKVGYVLGISGTHYGLSPQSCNFPNGETIIAVYIN